MFERQACMHYCVRDKTNETKVKKRVAVEELTVCAGGSEMGRLLCQIHGHPKTALIFGIEFRFLSLCCWQTVDRAAQIV